MLEIQSPGSWVIQHDPTLPRGFRHKFIFLAGSIEMGKAEEWQKEFIKQFKKHKDVVFLNPRRDDWDSSWTQSIHNKQFREQVQWELDALEHSDHIVMYFDPNTLSPISIGELCLHARTNKLKVVCPEGFWRKGNIDVICQRYNVQQYATMDDLIESLKQDLK